jgi:chaperone modulatory protein CbpM
MDTTAFLTRARLDAGVLEIWIGAGWVVPRDDAEAHRFAEIDVARARLIRDLKDDIGVNDEGVAIILDLIDSTRSTDYGAACVTCLRRSPRSPRPSAVRSPRTFAP